MSARDAMSKMLDQLMGQNRDGDENERQKHFTDREVCRPFLLGICVNELFINTREERGDCTKVHSITLKEEYEKASAKRDYRFEEEVLDYLKSFIRDNERKIEANKRRLESVEDDPDLEKLSSEIHEVAVQIGELVAKAEKLGNEGNIDESLAMLKDAEEIKGKKKRLEDEYHAKMPRHAQQQQKLKACEVCGAFLSMYDNDRRLADHFGGKLHMGFVQIREKIAMLEEAIQEKAERRRKEREERDNERRKRDRSSSRERYRDRDRNHDREREKHRSRSHRSRSRERDRERKHRHRSRSRERRRSRSRDRRRSRSRERRRSRSREGRESRSRDRYRSRSKERHRSRSRDRDRKRSR